MGFSISENPGTYYCFFLIFQLKGHYVPGLWCGYVKIQELNPP